MGNSLGGLSLYTDLEDKYEAYQGGFIWDYIDQAIETQNDDGKTVLAYGGDFEDRPSDYGFCTNGVVYANQHLFSKGSGNEGSLLQHQNVHSKRNAYRRKPKSLCRYKQLVLCCTIGKERRCSEIRYIFSECSCRRKQDT